MLRKLLKFHKMTTLVLSVAHNCNSCRLFHLSKSGKVTEINHFDVKFCFLIYQQLEKAECHFLYFTRHNTAVISYAAYLHILSNTPLLSFYKNGQKELGRSLMVYILPFIFLSF